MLDEAKEDDGLAKHPMATDSGELSDSDGLTYTRAKHLVNPGSDGCPRDRLLLPVEPDQERIGAVSIAT